jgi:hypothetical protein
MLTRLNMQLLMRDLVELFTMLRSDKAYYARSQIPTERKSLLCSVQVIDRAYYAGSQIPTKESR